MDDILVHQGEHLFSVWKKGDPETHVWTVFSPEHADMLFVNLHGDVTRMAATDKVAVDIPQDVIEDYVTETGRLIEAHNAKENSDGVS